LLFVFGLAAAGSMWWWARVRARRLRPIPEACSGRTVAELEAGRFRVTGRVVPIQTSDSGIDGVPCVFLEHVEYRTLGSELVPLMREVEHRLVRHPFFLDDGTGRLWIDPGEASVEAVTVFEDAGLSAERRLRAGEEVELVATFAPCESEADGGPYRAGHFAWRPIADDCGPPRITYRTVSDMVAPADDVTAFLRGAGVLVLVTTTLFGVLSLL
jgi:hypothetical protein